MNTDLIQTVPEAPALCTPWYPQLEETVIPPGSGATKAFRGYIRPFSDDATAKRVLRAIVAQQFLSISSGRLDSEADGLPLHPLEDFLTDMATPCTVLVLEFGGKEHHRAYLLDPPLRKRISQSAHVWSDKIVKVEGRPVPELCVYSGNLFEYDPHCDRLPQFLNQLAVYLAKHLIFLRTRMLHRIDRRGVLHLVQHRQPSEPINQGWLGLSNTYWLYGVWVGLAAPHGPALHLQTVDPDGQCWCNSGKLYRACHRPSELMSIRQMNRSRRS